MAIPLNGGGGSGGRRRYHSLPALAEINIIPLVDVVLVLLIIFMITANMMEFGLNIDVPKVRTVRNSAEELPVVSITKDGESYLNEKPVNINLLAESVKQRFHNARSVYVRADKETPWDPIAQVVSVLGDAKLEVKMVTKPTDTAAKGR